MVSVQGEAASRNERAVALYTESLALALELEHISGIAKCFEGVALLAGMQEQPERVAKLCGAADRLRESIGEPVEPAYRATYKRTVALARAGLSEAEFEVAWQAGRRITLEQAATYALEPIPEPRTIPMRRIEEI